MTMNIQDMGSIGELIAAAAIIATSIYLARQVRANTKVTQTASRVEITRDYCDMNNALFDIDISLANSLLPRDEH
jgi:hypothetical protein